jgi:hypothetical protein
MVREKVEVQFAVQTVRQCAPCNYVAIIGRRWYYTDSKYPLGRSRGTRTFLYFHLLYKQAKE